MTAAAEKRYRLGLIGARGYVGSELIRLLAMHPAIELAFVSSRERDGQLLNGFEKSAPAGMRYENLTPEQALQRNVDVLVLALPNGLAGEWTRAYDAAHSSAVLVDLSADYRFDPDWYYGLPELNRQQYNGQKRISNPGCSATAMQLAITPMCRFPGRCSVSACPDTPVRAPRRRIRMIRISLKTISCRMPWQATSMSAKRRTGWPASCSSCRMSRRISGVCRSP
mgnify:CR=1 FL=1